MYDLLISAEQLLALARGDAARLMIFDCSFDLNDAAAGRHAYERAHIPGAVHADLEDDLSDLGRPDAQGRLQPAPDAVSGGRHPLPSPERFATWLSAIGFSNDMQAVVYDRNGGVYCGRLWWMLKWVGHEAAALLDGGLAAWQAAGGEVTDREEIARFQANFAAEPVQGARVGADEVLRQLGQPGQTLIDARAPARFRGEVEPLDRVAGHIPGALNRPFGENFTPDGRFKPREELRREFEALLAGRDAHSVVHQCGSGVSATPNLLAMELAGLGRTRLYAGSWSEWSSDPSRPVEKG